MSLPIPHFLLFVPLFLFCAVALGNAATVLASEFLGRPKRLPPARPSAQIIYLSARKTPLASMRSGAALAPRRAANGG